MNEAEATKRLSIVVGLLTEADALNAKLRMKMARLKSAAEVFDDCMDMIGGCTNHGCMVVKPKGMGTNGPCHCLENKVKLQHYVYAVNELRKALEAI